MNPLVGQEQVGLKGSGDNPTLFTQLVDRKKKDRQRKRGEQNWSGGGKEGSAMGGGEVTENFLKN